MSTRFATTGPVGPQLGPSDAANLRTQFAALLADRTAIVAGTGIKTLPVLRIGTTAQNVRSDAFTFQISGVTEAKAAVAAGTAFTGTTHDVADGYHRRFVLSIAAGGTITITHGTSALHAADAVAPATPTGECKMGEVYIKATGALFDATTTALTPSSDLTVEYTDETVIGRTASALTEV